MRHPRLLVHDTDGKVAIMVKPWIEQHGWICRESKRLDAIVASLHRGDPSVLILRVGRNLDREFHVLDQVSLLCPDTAIVVLLDVAHPRLGDLAWDLGATCVLTMDQPRERLLELVEKLMDPDS